MPHFNIEVQGEKNPLDHQLVYKTLVQATGRQQQTVQVATEQLSNWETQPGYYSILQDIFGNSSVEHDVRLQAIIQLKHGVDKFWRKTSTNAIGKPEKVKIRSTALRFGVVEPSQYLALQNALVIGKIVRLEFPHDWPDAMTEIIFHLRNITDQPKGNILLITLQVIKELGSGKLQRTRKSLEQVSSELLEVLKSIYFENSTPIPSNDSYKALKSIRRLMVVGFEHPHRDTGVENLWKLLQQQHMQLWTLNGSDLVVQKHLHQLSKLHLEMARNHPASFALLPNLVEIINRSWLTINLYANLDHSLEEDYMWEKLALWSVHMIRACIKMVFHPSQTFKYQHPKDKEDRKLSVDLIKSQILREDFVLQLFQLIVTKFLPLNAIDLCQWDEEPEEFVRKYEEIPGAWEIAIRPSTEKLLLDLVINFKSIIVPKLQQAFDRVKSPDVDVFQKESVYSAIGIAAASLENVLDFNSFVKDTLVSDVMIDREDVKILRRRIPILLGQWVPIKHETLDRETVCKIFTYLIIRDEIQSNDPVVRLTAAWQLKSVLEPLEFKYEEFKPYVGYLLWNLMELIPWSGGIETKVMLLDSLKTTILKLGEHMMPYALESMQILDRIWTDSDDEPLVQQWILTVITAIMTSLKSDSTKFAPGIVSLIKKSITSPAKLYLLEEALELWTIILQWTPVDSNEYANSLYWELPPLFESGSDLLPQVFEICTSYILLSPMTVMKSAKRLFLFLKPFLEVLGSTRARDASLVPTLIEKMVMSVSLMDPTLQEEAFNHLMESIVTSEFLSNVVHLLKEAFDYHEHPQPNKRPPDISGPAETLLYSVVARFCQFNPTLTLHALKSSTSDIKWLIKEWINSIDTIGDVSRKKLQVLALSNLYRASEVDFMMEFLQEMLTIWTDLLIQLGFDAPLESQGDYLWQSQGTDQNETPEEYRKAILDQNDPVHSVNLRHFVALIFGHVIENAGGRSSFEKNWLNQIDDKVVKAFLDLQLVP